MIYLAANYVNYTDPLLGELNDDIGFGHLQLVKDGFEIEVSKLSMNPEHSLKSLCVLMGKSTLRTPTENICEYAAN